MAVLTKIAPISKAAGKLAGKKVVASKVRSRGWLEKVALQLRDRALFSSGIEEGRWLETVQDKLLKAITLQKERVANGEAYVDRSSFIGDLRKVARQTGISTYSEGLTDPGSRVRLGLVYDMQIQGAQNYARWNMDQDPDVLDAYPAQELIRVESRKMPRDWMTTWLQTGGKLYDGRMIALKTDPIWETISRFGTPWPPFDYGSGMGLADVSRKDAIALGVMTESTVVQPREEEFNRKMEASVQNLNDKTVSFLKKNFGDQVEIEGGRARWAQ